ncbi:MAG: hypothetical protein OXG58_03890 [Gemmatimonadetes bacterium]|nr:hypothetical protein [Gemmatimonadota bacterium]MCY3944505.1 hypothetical protein [Gemmatimonadota bacterium]
MNRIATKLTPIAAALAMAVLLAPSQAEAAVAPSPSLVAPSATIAEAAYAPLAAAIALPVSDFEMECTGDHVKTTVVAGGTTTVTVTVITGQCTGTANGDDFEVNAGETESFKLGAN